jgi:hypothetical protein
MKVDYAAENLAAIFGPYSDFVTVETDGDVIAALAGVEAECCVFGLTSKPKPGDRFPLVAMISPEDAPLVMGRGWYVLRRPAPLAYYAMSGHSRDGTLVMLHQLITGYPQTDHASSNGLDNRRENLRPATTSQNHANQRLQCNNTSGWVGVSWHTRDKKWESRIKVSGQTKHLGLFTNPDDAARARDVAAHKYFGDFARDNFPLPGERALDGNVVPPLADAAD